MLQPVDPALLERVQGQTSDLDWSLDDAAGPARLDRALDVARGSRLDAVIWFEPTSDGGLRVRVLDVGARRQLERTVARPAKERLASSTAAELAAFIVRSSLEAIAAGRTIGEPIAAPPSVPTPRAAPLRAPASTATLDLAGFLVAHGTSDLVDPGVWLAAGVQWTRLSVAIAAGTTGARESSFERAAVRLRRQQLGALAAWRVFELQPLELWARLGIGVLAYRRETFSVDPGFQATSAGVTVSPFAAPELALRVSPWRADWVALTAGFALDLVPASPTIAYALPDRTVDDRTLFRIQPRSMAGLQLRWSRP